MNAKGSHQPAATLGQGTGDRGQGTGDRGQGTGKGQGTGDRGQGTGDRGQGTGDRGQGTGDRVCFSLLWLSGIAVMQNLPTAFTQETRGSSCSSPGLQQGEALAPGAHSDARNGPRAEFSLAGHETAWR